MMAALKHISQHRDLASCNSKEQHICGISRRVGSRAIDVSTALLVSQFG